MACRVFIENPSPFKQMPRGDGLADVPITEGLTTVGGYLSVGLSIAGLHHSDLDRFEAREIRGEGRPDRHDSFDYALTLKDQLGGFRGLLIPHRVTVYQTPSDQEPGFRRLARAGIKDVVLVGRPFSVPPAGAVYRSTIEEGLAYLRAREPSLGLNLGAIGIHSRLGEADRIARKFEAAGGRLRVMGQFLDDVEAMIAFMDQLARAFETRHLDLGRLEWNVGLAIFALEKRAFYAKLLRKEALACEARFASLGSTDERIASSVDMNVEFAQRAKEHGVRRGMDIGFSIQPVIERRPNGTVHPAVHGAIELARRLHHAIT
jgi:hypothetical protein